MRRRLPRTVWRDLGLLAICFAIWFSAGFIAEAVMPEGGRNATVEVDKPVTTAYSLSNKALVDEAVCEDTDMEGEAPDEAERIEAALIEQEYFRDDVPLTYELQDFLHTACERYGVNYALALGVIEQESQFDPGAVGADGRDFGLFQIRDSNHTWLRNETGSDPMEQTGNIECGVWMLGYLLDRYDGNTTSALTAYRYGHDNGRRGYASAVLERQEKWEGKLNEQN